MNWIPPLLHEYGPMTLLGVLVIAAAAFLGRRTIEAAFAASTRAQEIELQKALARHKAELAKDIESYRITFTRLHETRANAVIQLFQKLSRYEVAVGRLVSPAGYEGGPTKKELAKEAATAGQGMIDFYYDNQILFPDETCGMVDELIDTFCAATIDMQLAMNDTSRDGTTIRDRTEFWIKADSRIREKVPPLRKLLRRDLQNLLSARGFDPGESGDAARVPPGACSTSPSPAGVTNS